MANFDKDVVFKYSATTTKELPTMTNNTAGTFYIKKKDSEKAELYLDTPDGKDRLIISGGGGGDVYVGDPDSTDAQEYEVVINPNGSVVNNVVTSAEAGGYIIRVVESEDPDNYNIAADNPARNVITLVVQK